jgi:AcrR family transcriptional regulator
MSNSRAYHHGDLRQAVLAAAVDALTEVGPAELSLRDLARRAGVSHAAPAYHFGDKAGLLTAVAEEGFELLADAVRDAQTRSGDFVEVGVAYVRFAIEHRAHFEVMYRPELYRADDVGLREAQQRAAEILYGGVRSVSEDASGADILVGGVAAWSLVHGFATLWLHEVLPPALGKDVEAAARAVARVLFPAP